MCGQCEETRDNKLRAAVSMALKLAAMAARVELKA